MGICFLAVDIGASNGRHILGEFKDGRIQLEEIYRFPNQITARHGHMVWDMEHLFTEIKNGMRKCKFMGKIPVSMGVDTWAVDYVLLDKEDRILGDTYAYRDARTEQIDAALEKVIPFQTLYEKTGIQKQNLNTINQLYAQKLQYAELLDRADALLLVPDYFHFLLTGEKFTEYTNATTTQLVNVHTKTWDDEILRALGLRPDIFRDIVMPGHRAGTLRREIAEAVGFDCRVVFPATHDTASAVMAVPNPQGDSIYISSGTWSLMGCELPAPVTSAESMRLNFTNEGGYADSFRYLKNIMGLWMIQSVRGELGGRYTYPRLCELAAESDIPSIVDCNDERFFAPDSMIEALRSFCAERSMQVPNTPGELAAVIYNSLAHCYRDTKNEIERITGKRYARINIIGGGAGADYLNELTAKSTGAEIFAGPVEATAIGNLLAQMIGEGIFASLTEARSYVSKSFAIKRFSAEDAPPATYVNA
ncbi:MAG: rhamnulokinase [Clostridiales Family XIII bacterium]|jgi:rhamnulokinase|nr:rhamnulokinase [Clostridiales Family XIII bacterium]